MEKEKVRELIAPEDRMVFDRIENHELLGATNHIAAIGEMIQRIASNPADDLETIKEKISQLAQYYIATRGEASQAITNAVSLMIQGLNNKQTREEIIRGKNAYFEDSQADKAKILEYAVNLSNKYTSLMCYDYSSTVKDFLIELAKDGKKRTLYIPESRVINGGMPFVEPVLQLNYAIRFIPDCALFYYMKKCDACYMGAETFYADGTGFNTLGSDLAGLVCDYWHVPLYFITPMIKLDSKANYGKRKELVMDDLTGKMTETWNIDLSEIQIDFTVPELTGVESCFITSFITEYGVIPANQMGIAADKYLNKVYGGDCHA